MIRPRRTRKKDGSVTIPDGALYEADLGSNVALYDVSFLLPVHRAKKYRARHVGAVVEQFVHHSGRLGRPGFAGMYNSARYVVNQRGWPGIAYHTWISREPVYDEAGHSVIFRGQPDTARTHHAGKGPNDRAIAHCLQGNTSRLPPSDFQLYCLGALIAWYRERDVFGIYGHCEAGADGHSKATCPGSHAMAFLYGVRA